MIRCMDPIQSLRKELDRLLAGKGAHADFDAAIADFPPKLRGVKPQGAPTRTARGSCWNTFVSPSGTCWSSAAIAEHVSPDWPAGYWPENPEPASAAAWDRSVKAFQRDLAAMRKLVLRSEVGSLYAVAHGEGQTLLREAMQMADHNAYHVGELIFLRRLLGAWK